MNRKGRTSLAIIVVLLFPASKGIAQIYKWQDELGKWHYSDTPPADPDREVEQSHLGPVNTSNNYNPALQNIFPEETSAERQHRQEKAASSQHRQAQKDQQCQEARSYLKAIEGRVVFLDQQGKAIPTTENEREEKARALRQQIERYCP